MLVVNAFYFKSNPTYNINNTNVATVSLMCLKNFKLGSNTSFDFKTNNVFFITITVDKTSPLFNIYNTIKCSKNLGSATIKFTNNSLLNFTEVKFLERSLEKGKTFYKFSAISC